MQTTQATNTRTTLDGLTLKRQVASLWKARGPWPNVKLTTTTDPSGLFLLSVSSSGGIAELYVPSDEAPAPIMTVVDLRALHDAVKPARKGDDVSLEQTDNVLCIRVNGSRVSLPTSDPDEAPTMPCGPTVKTIDDIREAPVTLTMHPESMAEALKLALPSTANEIGRYAVDGPLFTLDKGKPTIVATDGRRLAHVPISTLAYPDDHPACDLILPYVDAYLLQELSKRASATDSLEIVYTPKSQDDALVRIGHNTTYIRTVEGVFPDWRRVLDRMPHSETARWSRSAKSLSEVFKRLDRAIPKEVEVRSVRIERLSPGAVSIATDDIPGCNADEIVTSDTPVPDPLPVITLDPWLIGDALKGADKHAHADVFQAPESPFIVRLRKPGQDVAKGPYDSSQAYPTVLVMPITRA